MCEAFQVEDLALMIRATRGRSTERQRDRESRPNPLKTQGDSRKPPSPAASGWGAASSITSQNKLRKISKHLRKSVDFGSPNEPHTFRKTVFSGHWERPPGMGVSP